MATPTKKKEAKHVFALPEGRLINHSLFERDAYTPERGAPGKPMYKVELAFDKNQIAGRKMRSVLGQRGLTSASQLVHQHPACAAGQEHLAGTGLAMAKRVLPRLVDIKVVVRVLEYRDAQTERREARQQSFHQRCLARTGVTGNAEQLHLQLPAKP